MAETFITKRWNEVFIACYLNHWFLTFYNEQAIANNLLRIICFRPVLQFKRCCIFRLKTNGLRRNDDAMKYVRRYPNF